MKKQVFTKECKKRGFIQRGNSYIRVVGDGVFQHILLGFKERLDPSAPGYSGKHRYEPRILIYLKSMYARYDGLYISIDSTRGFSLTVPQLLDKQDTEFLGAAAEMDRMFSDGLDMLDTINTQRQIIEYLELCVGGERESQQYSTQLYDVYLYCEEFYKARMSIETEFAETYFSIMINRKHDPVFFDEEMQRFLECGESFCDRYMMTFPVQYSAAKSRLQNNYEDNVSRLREIGIL